MPPYIRLPVDEEGNLVYPSYRVTSLIEKRDAWARIIGNVDGVTWAILSGRLVYPRVSWMLTGSWLRNHPSYENAEVKSVLGPKIATYLLKEPWNGYHHTATLPCTLSLPAQCSSQARTSTT